MAKAKRKKSSAKQYKCVASWWPGGAGYRCYNNKAKKFDKQRKCTRCPAKVETKRSRGQRRRAVPRYAKWQ